MIGGVVTGGGVRLAGLMSGQGACHIDVAISENTGLISQGTS